MANGWGEAVVDALYSKLLLRDIFAKITPGAIPLFTLASVLFSRVELKDIISDLPLGAWIILFGLAWLMGFAIQAFGYFLPYPPKRRFIRYRPKDVDENVWHNLREEFRKRKDLRAHWTQHERLVVIKEACGNAYVSLSLSVILWFIAEWHENSIVSALQKLNDNLYIVLFIVLIISFLARMHFEHVRQQHAFIKDLVETDPL